MASSLLPRHSVKEVKEDPLLTWLERLLGEHGPILIEHCFDGTLFERALAKLEKGNGRGDNASVGAGGALAARGDDAGDDGGDLPALRAALSRAGLGLQCAPMVRTAARRRRGPTAACQSFTPPHPTNSLRGGC